VAELWLHGFPVVGNSADLARKAEAWGYDGLLLADSQCLQGDVYVGLALAVRATRTLRLGPGVTNPVTRHPTVTASAIATIHAESGGRAILGLGRGDTAVTEPGLRPASPEELRDHVLRLRALLRGETTDAGRLSWLDPALAPVEIDVAATGPRTIAAGAQAADRVTLCVGAEPERLRPAIAAARAAGPARVGAYVNVGCAEDPAVARTLVRGSAGIFAGFSAGHHVEPPDDVLDRFAVVGRPAPSATASPSSSRSASTTSCSCPARSSPTPTRWSAATSWSPGCSGTCGSGRRWQNAPAKK